MKKEKEAIKLCKAGNRIAAIRLLREFNPKMGLKEGLEWANKKFPLPPPKTKAAVGAMVQYCGHDGVFVADIFDFSGVCVIRAPRAVTPDNILRPAEDATHHLQDYPAAGFWRPDIGVFVVPRDQLTVL